MKKITKNQPLSFEPVFTVKQCEKMESAMSEQQQEAEQARGEVAYLTPALFQELDALARTEAGQPVSVLRHEDIKSFAEVTGFTEALFDITGKKPFMMKEGGCIKLANQINLQKVGACKRPEMDWTVLNTENVYQFVIQHEIAHVRRGDPMFYFEAQIRADFWTCGAPNGRGRSVAPKYKGIAAALEADADRAAWTALWPGKTMPKRPDMAMPPELLDDILERFKDDREKYQRCSIKSISTDPRLYVPYNHVKEGIPWALPVAAMPDFVPEF